MENSMQSSMDELRSNSPIIIIVKEAKEESVTPYTSADSEPESDVELSPWCEDVVHNFETEELVENCASPVEAEKIVENDLDYASSEDAEYEDVIEFPYEGNNEMDDIEEQASDHERTSIIKTNSGKNYQRKSSKTDEKIGNSDNSLKKYECRYCTFKTSWKTSLRKHFIAVHLRDKPYKCDYCDYRATRKDNLRTHVQTAHSKSKNHKCHVCDYATPRSSLLKNHIEAVHFKIKKYKCEYCDFAAAQSTNLKIHIKMIHLKDSVSKDYKCDMCDYSTFHRHVLESHRNVHLKVKNYKCEKCDFASSWYSGLNRHVHAKHKPKKLKGKCAKI